MIIPEVYYYDFSGDNRGLDDLRPLLSPERYDYCAAMKNVTTALRSAYCFLLLRLVLKQKFGLDEMPSFTLNEHGKPFLHGHPDIFFNMSHSGKSVVCAVSDIPVGVDIQDIRHLSLNTGRKFLTDEETDMVTGLEPTAMDRELCRIWCIKESYGKMTGKGFGEGFRSIDAEKLIRECRAFITFHKGFFISLCV